MIKRLLISLEDECVEYELHGNKVVTPDEAYRIVYEILTTYVHFENLFIDKIISDWEEEKNDNTSNPMFNFKVKGYFASKDEMEDEDFYPDNFNIFNGSLSVLS